MTNKEQSLYDTNDYYGSDHSASRLSSIFNSVLWALDKRRAKALLSALGTLKYGKVQRPVSVLDIGAGNGSFLYFARKRGAAVFGTTASQRAQQGAKRTFNLDLLFTTELESSLFQRTYDLVVYWHVFEHLAEPESHWQKWHALVSPGGYLVIEVPNVKSMGANICYSSWLGSDDEHHINHLPPQDIEQILGNAGFAVEKKQHLSLKFSYLFLWSALLGKLFGNAYYFQRIMGFLQSPLRAFLRHPILMSNALAALVYLFPIIISLIAIGILTERGEVFRIYAKRLERREG